jgi:hypothetical protein
VTSWETAAGSEHHWSVERRSDADGNVTAIRGVCSCGWAGGSWHGTMTRVVRDGKRLEVQSRRLYALAIADSGVDALGHVRAVRSAVG